MARTTLIKFHLYVAAFLVPFLFMMSLTGVLEILGVEGKIHKEVIFTTNKDALNFKSVNIKNDVKILLIKINANPDFDHLKIKENKLYTRPNYNVHYAFKKVGDSLKVYQYTPSTLQKLKMLHKGNGPRLYKLYQQIFVYGLFFVLLTGLWLGLTSDSLRGMTIFIFLAGILLYYILITS